MTSGRFGTKITVMVALLALLVGGLFFRQGGSTARAQEPVMEESELAEQMARFGRAVRRLRRQVSTPDKAEASLALVLEMQDACLAAKPRVPSLAADFKGEKKEAFVLGYRKKMIELMKGLLDLEVALLDGDFEKAGKAFEAVRKIEDEGHQSYRDLE